MDQKVINFIYENFKKPINAKRKIRNILVYREEITNSKAKINSKDKKNKLDKEQKTEIIKEIGYQEVRDFLKQFKISPGSNHNRTVFLNSIYYLYFNKLMTTDQECDFIKFLNIKYPKGFPDFAIILYAKNMLLAEPKKTIFEIIKEVFSEVLDISSLNHFPQKKGDFDSIVNSYFKELFKYIKKYFLTKDNLGYQQKDIKILIYLYYAIAFDTEILEFDYYIDFERAFLEYFGNVTPNKVKEKVGKSIPSCLIRGSTKSMIDLCYLYFGTMDKISSLESENKKTTETNNILKESIKDRNEEINLLQNKIAELNHLLIEKDNNIVKCQNDIDNLNKEIEVQKGKTEYNKNILNQQLDTLEDDIKKDILSRISIELNSIYDISTILDEKNAQRIQRRLEKINKMFD